MSLDAALRTAICDVLVAELPAVLAQLSGEHRMIEIKSAPVSYRAILAAEKVSDLRVYRIGKTSLVDVTELYDWIRRTGTAKPSATTADEVAVDEVGDLIQINEQRRSKRRGRAA